MALKSRPGTTATADVERVVFYPDRIYIDAHASNGSETKIVITPQFAYRRGAEVSGDLPPAALEDARSYVKFDIYYVAQHQSDFVFTIDGQETVGSEKCDRLRLKRNDGKEEVWSIDSTGKICRRTGKNSSGEYSTEFSDFQWVDGVNVPFHLHASHDVVTTDITVKQYVVNPYSYMLPTGLFDPPPATQMTQTIQTTQATNVPNTFPMPSTGGGLRVTVLEEQSVPYVEKLGEGPSTSCNITGGSNTGRRRTRLEIGPTAGPTPRPLCI